MVDGLVKFELGSYYLESKKPWEKWGQWEHRAQGRIAIEARTLKDEPKKKARGKRNPGK